MALNGKLTLEELVHNYEGCCELWKIKLAAGSIVEMGIPPRDWEDIMQEIMFQAVHFRYKPQDRVSEATALGTRLRSRITDWKRKHVRRQEHKKKYADLSLPLTYTIDLLRICGESPRATLRRAVRAAVARLERPLRRLCWMIMNDMSLREIARVLKIRWHEVRNQISQIRQQFIDMGLEAVIEWREMSRA